MFSRIFAELQAGLVLFLMLAVSAVGSASAADCLDAKPPEAGVNNVWYCLNTSDTAVVFVHGLHSDSRGAWMHQTKAGEDAENYWPHLVAKDQSLGAPSIFLAGFYTDIHSGGYGMAEAAEELFSHLNTPLGDQPAPITKKNIVFVGHSLGGILTRAVLTRHTAAFEGKRVALLLVASPSNGSKYANQLGTVAAIVNEKLVTQLQVGSDYLAGLENDFLALRDAQKIPGLIGKEIYEHQFIDLSAARSGTIAGFFGSFGSSLSSAIASLWGNVIVTRESAARYFSNPQLIPKSDHFTIATPDGLNHLSHQKLVELTREMLKKAAPACEPPASFKLVLDVKPVGDDAGLPADIAPELKAQLPQFVVWRVSGAGDSLTSPAHVFRDPTTSLYSFAPEAPFPCPSETFQARITRGAVTSFMTSTALTPAKLCFRRSQTHPGEKTAFLHCAEGGACNIDGGAPGMAEACAQTGWNWHGFIGAAEAEETPGTHWVAPSLGSLAATPAEIRPGYAEFSVSSAPLPGLADANAVSYAVTVNGVALHIDGLPPHTEHLPFNGADGVRIDFAVENLGFTGGEDGYEKIGLELKYYHAGAVIKTAHIERAYVSYRHAPVEDVTDKDSADTYQWSGYWRPAKIKNRYEVMLLSGKDTGKVREAKRVFDAGGREFSGKATVGVIRPARVENAAIGMALGLKLPTGQIKSSFDEASARDVCKWILADPTIPAAMRRSAYLYEFKAEKFTDTADRGVYKTACAKLK